MPYNWGHTHTLDWIACRHSLTDANILKQFIDRPSCNCNKHTYRINSQNDYATNLVCTTDISMFRLPGDSNKRNRLLPTHWESIIHIYRYPANEHPSVCGVIWIKHRLFTIRRLYAENASSCNYRIILLTKTIRGYDILKIMKAIFMMILNENLNSMNE